MKRPLLLSILLISLCSMVYSQEKTVIETNENKELEEVYEKMKQLKKEGIEFHYRKETIIKKEGVEDKRGYLKHLLSELEKAHKKGKK